MVFISLNVRVLPALFKQPLLSGDGYGMSYPYHAGCIEKVPKRLPCFIQVLKHL